MPQAPRNEFWRDLKPIVNSMKPDAQREVFHQQSAIDDERFYVPLSPTVGSRPLWISPRDNRSTRQALPRFRARCCWS
jgi:2,4'-dihydroxyacetophenone dioxygenase